MIKEITLEIAGSAGDGKPCVEELLKKLPLNDADSGEYALKILGAIKESQDNQEKMKAVICEIFKEITPLCCPISEDPKEWDGNMDAYKEDSGAMSWSQGYAILYQK